MNNKYNGIIDSLQMLRTVTVDEAFRKHIEQTVLPNRISSHSLLPLSAIRIALVLLIVLFIGSGSMVIASADSRPGGLLYPIKEAVTAVTNYFISKPKPKIENKLVISPTSTPTPTVTPADNAENIPPQTSSTNQKENTVEITPTPLPAGITPTPTVTPQTHNALSVSANVQVSKTPVTVNLTVGSTPPSGSGNNTSSKDNNPDAEGKTSLLPKVNVNTPIVNIGL